MAMMRAHRRYVKGNLSYEEAYRVGLRFRQEMYGDLLIWQVVEDLKVVRWRQGLPKLMRLLRFYPRGALKLISQRLTELRPKPTNTRRRD